MVDRNWAYNDAYYGDRLNHIAFPLGGLGAGMICLEGTGALSHFSLRNKPDVFNQPVVFSAIHVRQPDGNTVSRVLEGPVPMRKVFGSPDSGRGCRGAVYGLPRFSTASFRARFPFATVNLQDTRVPLDVQATGWSPFTPGDADSSSLPVAGLELSFSNTCEDVLDLVYSFHAANFMATGSGGEGVQPLPGGFILSQTGSADEPWQEGAFAASLKDTEGVKVNLSWFRGAWFDPISQVWDDIQSGRCRSAPPPGEGAPSPGASLFLPFSLKPDEARTIPLLLAWYVPQTNQRSTWHSERDLLACASDHCVPKYYAPWYASQFSSIEEVSGHWQQDYQDLRRRSKEFSDCFYDMTLPAEVVEAVAANLPILKSPTILRQEDGRLWGWEGCCDDVGCCAGSCTHVWNYAQAIPHLFPELERGMREAEFLDAQDEQGHQAFRISLPIGPSDHARPAAADGQLGGVLKAYREWRISGDTGWLRRLWPAIRSSLDYCVAVWDPRRTGSLEEPHHNTYDIEFWGPDGMCTSIYLAALKAAVAMGRALEEDVVEFSELLTKGRAVMENELFDGEYYYQRTRWHSLNAESAIENAAGTRYAYSPEAIALFKKEGPKYQYGPGCLADGVIGAWMARVCDVEEFLRPDQVSSHLLSVFRYNYKADLSEHANPQRPGYALGSEAGLLNCTWPKGGRPTLPFVYSNEVWTGIEYQVASHLMMSGFVDEGLTLVRACRDRYDGSVRNPFNEYECGHWYARAMASYALLQALSGISYDALTKTLTVAPSILGDFRSFFCWATGFGTAGVQGGAPFLDVRVGTIDIRHIDFAPGVPQASDFADLGVPRLATSQAGDSLLSGHEVSKVT